MTHGAPPPPDWMSATFDDSAWVRAEDYGENGNADNYWNANLHRPADEIGPDARWIWTSDGNEDMQHPGSSHNDVFCRIVIDHKKVNCKAAADRYLSDYGKELCGQGTSDGVARNCDAWAHFQERGIFLGRIWHSELCDENCGYHTAPFDWIDASIQAGGTELTFDNADDGSASVDLPFPFPFYGQVKTQAIVSANGFLTFSGEHHSNKGLGVSGGESEAIPSSRVPNDLVAAFWTDLNGGKVYTRTGDGACSHGIASGIVCCAASCGSCGGSGCQARPGGSSMCCLGRVRDSKVYCEENGFKPPCVSQGKSFTVEWADVPYYQGAHTASAGSQQQSGFDSGTNHFEVTLFSDGNIKFQYKDMTPNPNAWAPPR
jgi:hypothetical protein